MQGWGSHTYEDWRPTELFPTRSGLLGLLGACLGIDRRNINLLNNLAESVQFTIRADFRNNKEGKRLDSLRLCDYHTIEYARKVDGSENKNPVQSYRWYLFDSPFTVAIEEMIGAKITLHEIADAIRMPVYTPFLGRRSCPLSRPLLNEKSIPFEAESVLDALAKSSSGGYVIYSESKNLASGQKLRIRDVPVYGRNRKFVTREVYVHYAKEAGHVSE